MLAHRLHVRNERRFRRRLGADVQTSLLWYRPAADFGRVNGTAACGFRRQRVGLKLAAGARLLRTRDDQFGGCQHPIRNPADSKKRHHLISLDIRDKNVWIHTLQGTRDFHPNLVLTCIDHQQQSTPTAAETADAEIGERRFRIAVDVAGVASRNNAVVDIVILDEVCMMQSDCARLLSGKQLRLVTHGCRRLFRTPANADGEREQQSEAAMRGDDVIHSRCPLRIRSRVVLDIRGAQIRHPWRGTRQPIVVLTQSSMKSGARRTSAPYHAQNTSTWAEAIESYYMP